MTTTTNSKSGRFDLQKMIFKHTRLIWVLVALRVLFGVTQSHAQVFQFEDPILRGTGCPAGTARTVISPDGQSMSILFDRFTSQVPQTDGNNDNDVSDDEKPEVVSKRDARLNQRVCNMVVSAVLPAGMRADELRVSFDYRGFVQADPGVRLVYRSALLERQGLAAGGVGRTLLERRVWRPNPQAGAVSEDFNIRSTQSLQVRSRCAPNGATPERRVRFVLRNVLISQIMGNRPDRAGQITLDSGDVQGQMGFRLTTSACQ